MVTLVFQQGLGSPPRGGENHVGQGNTVALCRGAGCGEAASGSRHVGTGAPHTADAPLKVPTPTTLCSPCSAQRWRLRLCARGGSMAAGGTAVHCRWMAWPSCFCSRCGTVHGSWAPVFGLPARGWFLMSADALPPPTILGARPSAKKNKCWGGDWNVCGLWRERRPAYGSRSCPVGPCGALRTDDAGPSSEPVPQPRGWKLRRVKVTCLLLCTWVQDVG